MSKGSDRAAGLLDVRAGGADRHALDGLARSELAERAPGGRLVVVDDTGALVEHHEWYVTLSIAVRDVICVAVGPIGERSGYELRQSAAVRRPWVTLWVGDERGVRWAGGSDDGADIEEDAGTFGDLLGVLASPTVFDEVLRQVGEIPYQTASPALAAVMPRVGAAELRALHRRALQEITAPGPASAAVAPLPLSSSAAPSEPPGRERRQVVPVGSPLGQLHEQLGQQIDGAQHAVHRLSGASGLIGAGDGRRTWRSVAAVGAALGAHEEQADVVLKGLQRRIDGNAASGSDELGLPDPEPSDDRALAAGLRGGVTTALRAGATLPEVTAMLRALGRQHASQATGPARRQLDELRAAGVPARLENVPAAILPGSVLGALAVGALGTTLVASALPALGGPAGAVLALLWVGLVLALLLRKPAPIAPRAADVAVPVLVVAGAAGIGLLTGPLLTAVAGLSAVPIAVELAVDAVLVAICLGTVVWGWNAVVSRWSSALDLGAARSAHERLTTIVDDVISGPYRQARSRARTQEAADLLAVGMADVSSVYLEWAASTGPESPGHPSDIGAPGQLVAVLRGDLATLAVGALGGCLDDIEAGGPLQVSPTAVTNRTTDLTKTYQDYVDLGSIDRDPPVASEPQIRARLADVLWKRSPGGRQLLTGDLRVPMTQLCRREDLRALDRAWRGIRVFRFAPAEAQRVLLDAVSEDIVETRVGAAGLLRLVPLRGGVVRHVQPTSDGAEHTIRSGATSTGPE